MGIGGIRGVGAIQSGQRAGAGSDDLVSKNIQSEILSAKREKQQLSGKEDITVQEKMKKGRELQQEIRSLDEQLKQRQEEVVREQQKEALRSQMLAENGMGKAGEEKQEDEKPEEKEENRFEKNRKDVVEIASAARQEMRQNRVIARMESGIVILKGEIRRDEARGVDTQKKEEELKRREEKLQKAVELELPRQEKKDRPLGEGVRVRTERTKDDPEPDTKREKNKKVIIRATSFSLEND